MSSLMPISTKYSISSVNLPLTCMLLKKWTLIRLKGKDIVQYLHNQLTCNIKNLNKYQYSFAAHCNPHGKMISNMYVFYFNDKEIAFIQKKNICNQQITAMKKYAIFSNITITQDNTTQLIGIAGENARQYLNTFFPILPDMKNTVIHMTNAILLYFNKPIERFLLIITNENKLILHRLLNQSTFNVTNKTDCQWTILDIEAGYPWIESETSEMFVPQAINMDTLQGVSFNKGCYIGQESIARIQYLGGNKRALFRLINTTLNKEYKKNLLKPGAHLELKITHTNEKYIGIVLQIAQITEHHTWIQVILHKSILKYCQQQFTIKTTQTGKNNFCLSC